MPGTISALPQNSSDFSPLDARAFLNDIPYMSDHMSPLFCSRRFLPLFLTQFLGAFNDNLFKNALVIWLAFKTSETSPEHTQILIIAAGGLFIFPYILFSATAGQWADKYEKARLARLTKLWEILVVALGAIGFLGQHPSFLLAVLAALGLQSAFFSPVKYALLPEHLHEDELMRGNAWIEAATFLAILLGTMCGGILIAQESGDSKLVLTTLLVALLGYAASWWIPKTTAAAPDLEIDRNIFRASWQVVRADMAQPQIFHAIIGITWLWVLGAVYLSQFPMLAKQLLHGDEGLVTVMLTMFSLGIGVGSLLAAWFAHGSIHTRFVPYAAVGMAIFSCDAAWISHVLNGLEPATALDSARSILSHPAALRLLIDLFMVACCGGIFVVPLYALMQHESDPDTRARTIASNNIVNAVFMVFSAVLTTGVVAAGGHFTHIAVGLGVGSLAIAYSLRPRPRER